MRSRCRCRGGTSQRRHRPGELAALLTSSFEGVEVEDVPPPAERGVETGEILSPVGDHHLNLGALRELYRLQGFDPAVLNVRADRCQRCPPFLLPSIGRLPRWYTSLITR